MPVVNTATTLRIGSSTVNKAFMGTTQVWPGAGPIDFYPDELSGLAGWYYSDWTEWYEGQTINFAWSDSSGNGNDLAMVGSPGPKFYEKAGDDRPIIRFKASEGRFRASSTGVTTEWTLVYVARLIGPTPGRIVTAYYPPANLLVGFWNGYVDVMYDNGFTSPNTQTAWTTDWKLYSGDGTSGLSRLFSNGVFMGSTTTAAGWNGTLNVSGYAATEETCDCEVAEIVMYNRKLSDVERQQVEEYLRVKWEV